MSEVIYENEEAIFEFSLSDVKESLLAYSSRNVKEAKEIQGYLKQITADQIKIPEDLPYFAYIALDLLNKNKGFVFCKSCKKKYLAESLELIPIGLGNNPFNLPRQISILKKLFSKKYVSGFGGEAFLCPEGHDLISLITWIS